VTRVVLSEILQMLLLLVAVLAMAAFCSRLLLQHGVRSAGFLKVLDRAYFGPSRQVVLLAAGERVILLGLSDKRLEMLVEMSRDELGDPGDRPLPVPACRFGEVLRRALRRRPGSVD